MRVGLDCRRAGGVGGVDRYMRSLVRALLGMPGWGEAVLFSDAPLGEIVAGTRVPVEVRKASPAMRMLRRRVAGLLHRRACRGIDLVHFPTTDCWYAKGAQTVVTCHGCGFLYFPEWSFPNRGELRRTMRHLRRVAEVADLIIAVSKTSMDELVRDCGFPPGKMRVVYHGVDEAFHPRPAEQVEAVIARYGIRRPYVLYVGGINKVKNIPVLLEAMAILRGRGSDLGLVLVGGVPPGQPWRDPGVGELAERLHLTDRLVATGPVSDPDGLAAMYSGASVFAFPSHWESFGLPPLEAMACGTPVVTSTAACLPEVTADAAVRVSPDEPEALADAIEELAEPGGRRDEMIRRGLAHAARFSWEQTARRTLEIYEELAG